jgi:hypothetical protein
MVARQAGIVAEQFFHWKTAYYEGSIMYTAVMIDL